MGVPQDGSVRGRTLTSSATTRSLLFRNRPVEDTSPCATTGEPLTWMYKDTSGTLFLFQLPMRFQLPCARKLVEELRMHLAWRWFTGLGFDQEVPHHSTFSKIRHGRLQESNLFEELFAQIVQQCVEVGEEEKKRTNTPSLRVKSKTVPPESALNACIRFAMSRSVGSHIRIQPKAPPGSSV